MILENTHVSQPVHLSLALTPVGLTIPRCMRSPLQQKAQGCQAHAPAEGTPLML
jgi:hypothetical protein